MAGRRDLVRRAYELGSVDRYAGRAMADMAGGDSAWLMDELGEVSATTARNAVRREAACDAYEDGWHAADDALR